MAGEVGHSIFRSVTLSPSAAPCEYVMAAENLGGKGAQEERRTSVGSLSVSDQSVKNGGGVFPTWFLESDRRWRITNPLLSLLLSHQNPRELFGLGTQPWTDADRPWTRLVEQIPDGLRLNSRHRGNPRSIPSLATVGTGSFPSEFALNHRHPGKLARQCV